MPEIYVNTERESHSTEKPKKYEAMTPEEKEDFKIGKAKEYMKANNVSFRIALEKIEEEIGG
jgi:hypothetical protein